MASGRRLQIIPVLDLQNGKVVRGVAGRREEYRPIVSRLTASTDPVLVAEALQRHFGFRDLYLADLDAIAGARPADEVYRKLHDLHFLLHVDSGITSPLTLDCWVKSNAASVVVGLETILGVDALAAVCRAVGSRALFSLDLRQGTPLARGGWKQKDAWGIVCAAIEAGVQRILVLDLAQVGVGAGPGTEELCAEIIRTFSDVEVLAGGGVRGLEDLVRLRDLGVSAVLVASALHDGRLTREQLATL